VRHITYHSNRLGVGLEKFEDFVEFLEEEAAEASHLAQLPLSHPYLLPADLHSYHESYHKYLLQHANFSQNRTLEYQLSSLFRKLPNPHMLDSIYDESDWTDHLWLSPESTRLGLVAAETLVLPRSGGCYVVDHLNWMLQAAAEIGLSITSVRSIEVLPTVFDTPYDLKPAIILLLGELEHVELAMFWLVPKVTEQWLPPILLAAHNLKSLSLSFGSRDDLSGTR
jgi:hypothetical protein